MGVVCGSRKIEPESRAVQAALVGPKTSGKSALITCFMAHKFRPEYHPTYTPNIGVKAFTFENAPQVVTLEVWEFGDVKDVPKNFNVVLVALDISQDESVLTSQYQSFHSALCPSFLSPPYTLVFTKCDLLLADRDQATLRKALSVPEDVKCYMTSALLQEGVWELFLDIVRPTVPVSIESRAASTRT